MDCRKFEYASVYIHKCPNDKVYVGVTSRRPKERWGRGSGYKENVYFYKAIQKYGWDNISHIIVAENIPYEEAYEMEKQLISQYDSCNPDRGYNLTTGGDKGTPGYKHSKEAKEKMSKSSSEMMKKRKENGIRYTFPQFWKEVLVYNLRGELLFKCKSTTEAQEITGVKNTNICACCKGKINQVSGYIFRYSNDTSEINLSEIEYNSRTRSVDVYDKSGKLINMFNSIQKAAEAYGVSASRVCECCRGKTEFAKGYKFKYAFQ